MGKSPAKWIKTVLFGKKSTRSHGSKGRNAVATHDKGYNMGKGSPVFVGSPVISEPVLVNTESNGIVPALENGAPSNLGGVTLLTSQDVEKQGGTGTGSSNDHEKFREEQAAIKAQAAFRGYLARRAFRALRGIIRLQALVRGHLVRRQAVATLRAMQGIVKLQALVRGQRVRCSGVGLEIYTNFGQRKAVETASLGTWKEKVATTAFVCKLLSSSPVAMPLQVQYDSGESNSVSSWLERWTSYCSWKQLLQPKKVTDSKSHFKRGSSALETETVRPKRSVRRNLAGSVGSVPTNVVSELEKPKLSLRKVSGSPAESVQENPQSELEKVKRNLRKVSNLMTEASERPEVEIDKTNRSLKKVSNTPSDALDQGADESAEKAKKDIASTPEKKPDLESASKSVAVEGAVDEFLENSPPVESHPLQSIDKEDNLSVATEELSYREEQTCHENQKTSKRRASFSAKTEYAENGLQNTPPLPSYMAKTESSKAKLRGQGSPWSGSDTVDRNGITRRHSLPSSTNGKLSLHSPRTQRLVQASGKGSVKIEKSLLSSRDGNERPIQVEWRR